MIYDLDRNDIEYITFLAVQDSSIDYIVSQWVSESLLILASKTKTKTKILGAI